jgi:hypothetical protein
MQAPTYGPGIPYSPAVQFLQQAGMWQEDLPEPPVELPPQVDVALSLLRQGYSEIEVRLELQQQYGTSARPNQAFKKALVLLVEEEHRLRPVLPERVQAIRFRAIEGAMRDRQWGAVAKLLVDALPEAAGGLQEGMQLAITIEEATPLPGGLLEAAEEQGAGAA